jgi:hypothetical protein
MGSLRSPATREKTYPNVSSDISVNEVNRKQPTQTKPNQTNKPNPNNKPQTP